MPFIDVAALRCQAIAATQAPLEPCAGALSTTRSALAVRQDDRS